MGKDKLEGLAQWIKQELVSLCHGEIHVILKIRDGRVALIEKTKLVKEKP